MVNPRKSQTESINDCQTHIAGYKLRNVVAWKLEDTKKICWLTSYLCMVYHINNQNI